MRGNPDAVASAYSLDDYRIADDLGGEAAYANLRDRAWARGIRLASDMVPNHMGIDSRWVIDHPEWFLSLPEPPFPAYTYTGPDLSHGRARRDRAGGPLLERHRRGGRLQALRPRDRRRALRLPRQRRHELPVERHRPARLPLGRGPRARHPGHPRRRAPLPDHPLRRGDGPRPQAHPAPVVAAARASGDGIPSRAQYAISPGGVRPADAERVLARGRRPGRGRGARTRSCWPRRSGCSRATSSGRSACTASTTARSCTCSATRTGRATGSSSARPSSSIRRSSSATSTS